MMAKDQWVQIAQRVALRCTTPSSPIARRGHFTFSPAFECIPCLSNRHLPADVLVTRQALTFVAAAGAQRSVVVGPLNSGKSSALRALTQCRTNANDPDVIVALSLHRLVEKLLDSAPSNDIGVAAIAEAVDDTGQHERVMHENGQRLLWLLDDVDEVIQASSAKAKDVNRRRAAFQVIKHLQNNAAGGKSAATLCHRFVLFSRHRDCLSAAKILQACDR